jgi:hypothetical protein
MVAGLLTKIAKVGEHRSPEPTVATPAGPSGYHLVAVLHSDNLAAIQAAFGSAEGQAAAADVQTFATGGANMMPP